MQKFNALLAVEECHRPVVIIHAVRNETEIKSDAESVPVWLVRDVKKNTSVDMQSVTRFLEMFRRDRARNFY